MAVGNQFGYLATSRVLSLPIAGRPSLHCAMTGLPGRQGQQSLAAGDGASSNVDKSPTSRASGRIARQRIVQDRERGQRAYR